MYNDTQYPPIIPQVGRSVSNPHADGTDNYKWIIDQNGQPIYVPSSTDRNNSVMFSL